MVVLHGSAGYLDELVIAFAAFAVLWIAVKLARQKPAEADDEAEAEAGLEEEEHLPPVAQR